jgi:hypothetical protein
MFILNNKLPFITNLTVKEVFVLVEYIYET